MTGGLRIRPAVPGDLAALAALVEPGDDPIGRAAFGARLTAARVALLAREPGPPRGLRLVAEAGGVVAGTARLALAPAPAGTFEEAIAATLGGVGRLRAAAVRRAASHRLEAGGEAYLEELAVRADLRRRGVGRALLAECLAEARAAGRDRLTLWALADRAPALALYRSMGLVPVGHERRLLLPAPPWRARLVAMGVGLAPGSQQGARPSAAR